MHTPTRIGTRYRIEQLVGSGGMGLVYKAFDLERQSTVAVKMLQSEDNPDLVSRFTREAQALSGALARLHHPAIVELVDAGATDDGRPYMVMEWLEGCGLDAVIRQRALPEAKVVELGLRVCDALAALHDCGLVHRDLKPSNLFLVGGRLDQVKLIDFGLVRTGQDSTALTRTGMFLGTPGYVAPEQAQGLASVDARADLYSLGAVLFAALTQKPPFAGEHVMAVLARLLLQPAPRVRELRRDVSARLDALIAELLVKEPSQRPASAHALAAALAAIGSGEPLPAGAADEAVAVSHREERYLSVLLISSMSLTTAFDWSPTDQIIAAHAGQRQLIGRHTAMVAFSADSDPTELVVHAARCALAIRERHPELAIVLATGRGVPGPAITGSPVLERAIDLLAPPTHALEDTGDIATDATLTIRDVMAYTEPTLNLHAGRMPVSCVLVVDEMSARLLRGRMRVSPMDHGAGAVLLGPEPAELEPEGDFVGRDRELAAIEATLAECIDERTPRAALLLGPAGAGKSRLLHELERRCRDAAGPGAVTVLAAQADPLRSSSAFELVGQLVRTAVGIQPETEPKQRIARICDRVRQRLAPADQDRVAAFLGELAGVPFAGAAYEPLGAIRTDPKLLCEQMRLAWLDWLSAEAGAQPQLLAIEDLHWADAPSIGFIDSALGTLDDAPLMVLATARPEVDETHPAVFANHQPDRIALKPLPKRAAAELAQALLPQASPAVIGEMVDRAAGNPFFLRELAAAARAGKLGDVPDTVLALVTTRLRARSVHERRVLRAASVLGHEVWPSAIAALVGQSEAAVTAVLEPLVTAGLMRPARMSRFAAHPAYHFEHALIRDAAYATLTSQDRGAAHLGAARWLASAGEHDLLVIAEHYARSHAAQEALPLLQRAGERLWAQSAFREAYGCYDRMRALLDAATPAPVAVATYMTLGEVAIECGWLDKAAVALEEALRRALAAGLRREQARIHWALSVVARTHARWPDTIEHARRGLELVNASEDVIIAARLHSALGWVLGYALGNNQDGLPHSEQAVALLEPTPHRAELATALAQLGGNYMRAGRWRDQLACNRRNLAIGEQLGLLPLQARARLHLGVNLHCLGELEESQEQTRLALALYQRLAVTPSCGLAHSNLAQILLDQGELDAAERELGEALRISEQSGGLYYSNDALQTQVRLAGKRGRWDQALASAQAALEMARQSGSSIDEGIALRVLGCILSHTGQHERAAAVLDQAVALLATSDLGEHTRALAERARAHQRSGNTTRSRQDRAQALEVFERLGVSLDIQRLDDLTWI